MRTAIIRALRAVGWTAAALAILPVLAVVIADLARGPAQSAASAAALAVSAREVLSLPNSMWASLARTGAIAALVVAFSFLIAIPAAYALSHAAGRTGRAALHMLVAWPLLAPPCVIVYAWTLLATEKTWLARFLTGVIGWNTRGMAPVVSAWIQATWLWPVPALAMAAAYRLRGRGAMRLAMLDASSWWAFWRAGLPSMNMMLVAAGAGVFLLSLGDATISPLMLVPDVWAKAMLDEVIRAHHYADPTRFMLWRSWPMLLAVLLLGTLAVAGLRPIVRERENVTPDDLGTARRRDAKWSTLALLFTSAVSLLPLVVLVCELGSSSTSLWTAIAGTAVYRNEWRATLITAALAALAGVGLGLAATTERGDSVRRRRLAAATMLALIALATLPPVVVGRSLISAFDRDWGIPRSWHWHPYDDTPLAWLAGIVARFGFVPMLIAWMARRSAGDETAETARVDGATPVQVLAHVRMAELWPALAVGGVLLGCLTISELAVSSLVSPVRFGGSLAVTVDQQVHFGRQVDVVATSLLLTLPAAAAAGAIAWLTGAKPR